MTSQCRYPDIAVAIDLDAPEGNPLGIITKVASALRMHGAPQPEIDTYFADALSGDYNHVLNASAAMVRMSISER